MKNLMNLSFWYLLALYIMMSTTQENNLSLIDMCFNTNRSFCVLKKWVHSRIGQCVRLFVRPAVYTMTFERRVRSGWNFLHSLILTISRSNSKMRMIGQEMVELSKKLSSLIRSSLTGDTGIFFKKNILLIII